MGAKISQSQIAPNYNIGHSERKKEIHLIRCNYKAEKKISWCHYSLQISQSQLPPNSTIGQKSMLKWTYKNALEKVQW